LFFAIVFGIHPTTSQPQKVLREIFIKVKILALIGVGILTHQGVKGQGDSTYPVDILNHTLHDESQDNDR